MQHLQHINLSENDQEQEDPSVYAEDEPLQTMHLYVYAEEPEKPVYWNRDRIVTLVVGLLTLTLLVGLCFVPSEPSYTTQTLTVPAYFQTHAWQASVAILPTGKQAIPATPARGILTLYNGSIFTQQVPANFLVTTANGFAVATDQAVSIPPVNPPTLGIATVAAHAIIAGAQGNIPVDAIQQSYGSDISIKNLVPFTGGHDASVKIYATGEDQQHALEAARQQLIIKQPVQLLAHPCTETIQPTEASVTVSWQCQYVTYQAPAGVQVLAVRLAGDRVFLLVRRIVHPTTTHFAK